MEKNHSELHKWSYIIYMNTQFYASIPNSCGHWNVHILIIGWKGKFEQQTIFDFEYDTRISANFTCLYEFKVA